MSLRAALVLAGPLLAFASVKCLPTLKTDPPYPVRVEQACGDGVVDEGDAGEQCDSLDGAVGCLANCRIDCAGGAFDALTGSCYFARGVADTFREAVERCEREQAHLVTIGSDRERRFVEDSLKPKRLWVGLSFDARLLGFASVAPDEPGWSERCPGCFAVNPLDASEPCVEQADAAWSTRPAVSSPPLEVVCERSRPGRSTEGCADGVCIHAFGGKRYLLALDEAVADVAVANCAALGGRLVTIDSAEERAYLARELRATLTELGYTRGVWLGLSKESGEWRWIDDAGIGDRANPWGEGEPSEDDAGTNDHAYAELSPNRIDAQLARAANKLERRPYVCEFR